MRIAFAIIGGLLLLGSGCSVVSNNRVFPKLTWYWQWEAKAQRAERARSAEWAKEYERTNAPARK